MSATPAPAEAIIEVDRRLADIAVKIASKRKIVRTSSLNALFDKDSAAARAKVKSEIVELEAEQSELSEARSQANLLLDEQYSMEVAARRHADAVSKYQRQVDVNAKARDATRRLATAATMFVEASQTLSSIHPALYPHIADQAHAMPKRVLRGMFDELRILDMAQGLAVRDTVDIWDISIGAPDHFLAGLQDPEAP